MPAKKFKFKMNASERKKYLKQHRIMQDLLRMENAAKQRQNMIFWADVKRQREEREARQMQGTRANMYY